MHVDVPAGHDEAESERAIHAAVDAGLTLIDTADRYGAEHNERLVGRPARPADEVVLATRIGFCRAAALG